MSSLSDPGAHSVLEAARTLFARHGFQRTSMAHIAREACIARATLYTRFSDKQSVFVALAAWQVAEALSRSEAAWREGATPAENIEATILAKDLGFFHLLTATPHGAELLAVDAELTRTHVLSLDMGFAALLSMRGAELQAQGADLTAFGGPDGFAHFIATAGAGLKHETRTEDAYRAAVCRLAQVAARAALPLSKGGG